MPTIDCWPIFVEINFFFPSRLFFYFSPKKGESLLKFVCLSINQSHSNNFINFSNQFWIQYRFDNHRNFKRRFIAFASSNSNDRSTDHLGFHYLVFQNSFVSISTVFGNGSITAVPRINQLISFFNQLISSIFNHLDVIHSSFAFFIHKTTTRWVHRLWLCTWPSRSPTFPLLGRIICLSHRLSTSV